VRAGLRHLFIASNQLRMQIRPYQSGDAEGLADLYVRSVRHFGPRAYSQEQVEAWASTISAEKIAARASDGRIMLVAADEQRGPLAFGDLEPNGHLDFLYCAPEAAGQGLSSKLYAALEEHARSLSLRSIFVGASELARPLFERNGFRVARRNDLQIGDVAIHNFAMEKILK
jgi:putative acetyltransferase